jgi:hypothetical protein
MSIIQKIRHGQKKVHITDVVIKQFYHPFIYFFTNKPIKLPKQFKEMLVMVALTSVKKRRWEKTLLKLQKNSLILLAKNSKI